MTFFRFFLSALLLTIVSSCSERARISRQLSEFTGHAIIIPPFLHKVESGKVMLSATSPDTPAFIFYGDSLSCSVCQINLLLYLDCDGNFARQNFHIPSDKRFHSFLIGRNGKPIFVGDPLAGDALWNLFCKVVDEMNTEKP